MNNISEKFLQEQFLSELLKIPGQKGLIKTGGYDFNKSFDENYEDGYRFHKKTKTPEHDEALYADKTQDEIALYRGLERVLCDAQKLRGTPYSKEYKDAFKTNILDSKKFGADYDETLKTVGEIKGAMPISPSPDAEL